MRITESNRMYAMMMIKFGVTFFALYLIYLKLISHDDLSLEVEFMKENLLRPGNLTFIFLLYVLMFVNWFLEALKWKALLGKWVNTSMPQLIRSVFSGVTVSLFTPNRVGEFAGRVVHLRKRDRVFGALSSIVGSMNQLMITILCGTFFLTILSGDMAGFSEGKRIALSAFCTVVSLLFLFIYFNIDRLPAWINDSIIGERFHSYLESLKRFNKSVLFGVSVLSFIRYVVFTTQYVILLDLFHVDVSVVEMVTLVSVMYLVTSVIPGFALSELALRGSVAMQLFPDDFSAGVLGASVSIWLINIVSPAVIGAISFLYVKVKR
jgi:uncharacterized membrane protein YbhN (UPF0104 family)